MALYALDTETTGKHLYSDAKMFSFSTCDQYGETAVYRLDGKPFLRIRYERELKKLLQNDRLVFHNAKFDLTAVERYFGEHVAEDVAFHDTYIQSHLLRPDHANFHRLKDLAWELAGYPKDDEAEVLQFVRDGGDYSMVPVPIMDRYQRGDAERTMLLHLFFYPKIREAGLLPLYKNELELTVTTMRMEERGVRVSMKQCNAMIEQLTQQRETIINTVWERSGRFLNLNAADDVRWLLFEWALLDPIEYTQKTGEPSTSKNTLHHYGDLEVVQWIQAFRSYSRGIATFKNYMQFTDDNGIIHPSINTNGAVTGRESCQNPNLQNVSKADTLLNPYPIPARRVFVPRIGYVNVHIDYSGIEMRLLVHYSHEKELIGIMKQRGDVHLPATELFYGERFRKADAKQKKVLRSAAKNANFALPYGASFKKLAETLGVSTDQGRALYDAYRKRFPALATLSFRVSNMVRENGHIKTVFERAINVPHEQAYIGTNYLIQSTAADIMKYGQNRVHKYLRANFPDAHLLLPIHDELIIEWPRKQLKELKKAIVEMRALMVDFPQFSVPLDIEAELAVKNWAEKSEVIL